MSQPAPPGPSAHPGSGSTRRTLLGLALLLPALAALTWAYVVPTVSTVMASFQHGGLFGPSEPAGVDNYRFALEDGVVGQFAFALWLGVLPLAFAVLVAPLFALLADRTGRVARLVTRGVLVLPVAGYAPSAVFLGWAFERFPPGTLEDGAWLELAGTLAATSFGLVVAVAATAYLSALRRSAPDHRPGPAMLTVGGMLALGVPAMALQIFIGPSLITGGGPWGSTMTPLMGTASNFSMEDLGPAAATSTLLLLVLGLLGLGAAWLLLATRSRIEFEGRRDDGREQASEATPGAARGPRYRRLGLLAVALVVFLGIVGWAVAPWLTKVLPGDGVPGNLDTTDLFTRTWGAPLIGALVSVGLAAVAGFGIGALRPLGRWSELLLLPFAPWLFVGLGPVLLDHALRVVMVFGFERGPLGLPSMIPLAPLSIPALFVFTLLFRGQCSRWRGGGGVGRALLVPALPMLLLAVLLTTLLNVQQTGWIAPSGGTSYGSAPLLAEATALKTGELDSGLLGLVLPLPIFVVFLVAFVGIQLGYLDRLTIRVGRATPEQTPPSPEPVPLDLDAPDLEQPADFPAPPDPAHVEAPEAAFVRPG
jgi:ABC-type sugar transport system permease subunit